MKKEKIRQTDFEAKELPKTRHAQYWDLFRHRFLDLVKLSLLQAIFLMPLIGTIVLFWVFFENSPNLDAAFTTVLLLGPTLLISLVSADAGYTGLFYALKKLAFRESEFSASDFFIGLAENWKRGVFIGLLHGGLIGGSVIGTAYLFAAGTAIDSLIFPFGIVMMLVVAILASIMSKYMLAQSVVYTLPFKATLKNAFLFTLMKFPLNFLILLLHPGILFVAFFAPLTAYVVCFFMIFFIAFSQLVSFQYALSVFDKHINKDNFPELFRKGLYKGE